MRATLAATTREIAFLDAGDADLRKYIGREPGASPATALGPVNTGATPDDEREVDESDKYEIEFVEAAEDAAKALESSEEAFDRVVSANAKPRGIFLSCGAIYTS
jgi:DNA-dependent RNA polymerase auxiliary subunit epsilon